MKFLDRVGLAIFSILMLIISILVLLISFGYIDTIIFGVLLSKALSSQTGTYITIAVSAILALLSIKCLFFGSSGKKDDYEEGILLENEDGKLLITKNTLANVVDGVVKEFPNIESADPEVILSKDNEVKIHVSMVVEEGTVIKDVSSKLQTKVKKAVKDATDLDITAVDIKVSKVETKVEESKEDDKD